MKNVLKLPVAMMPDLTLKASTEFDLGCLDAIRDLECHGGILGAEHLNAAVALTALSTFTALTESLTSDTSTCFWT